MGFFCARKSIISALTGKIAAKGGRIVKNLKIVIICLGLCFLAACGAKEAAPSGDKMISLYVAESGETTEMPLEEYLCGVVAAEMDVNWPKEALAAQAILARTFTLEKINSGGVKAHGTDASTDVEEFQAYDAEKINDNVKAAVSETKGEVVTYNGELIKAWFFSDGGGVTASSAEEGLSYNKTETPYIQSVEDPGAKLADNENNHWEADFTADEVKSALQAIGVKAPAEITSAEVSEYGASGRAVTLDFSGAKAGAVAFRLAIGSERMKSTLIEKIAVKDGALCIEGRGYGHGVGMSQWGARALAEEGKSAEDIVKYFFKDVEIEDLAKL